MAHGRIDWMSRNKVFAVVIYKGAKDVRLSTHATYEQAADALRAYVDSL